MRSFGFDSAAVVVAGFLVAVAAFPQGVATQATYDWPQWRGQNRDGISGEKGLLRQWPAQGPPLRWTATGVGGGYSSMAVASGRIYTLGYRGRQEFVLALDAATGKEVWRTPNGDLLSNDRGDGPRGTPTLDGDRLYALGGTGTLSCLDVKSGKPIWTVNVLRQFGGSNIGWGLSESPLVLDDRVLVQASARGAAIVALNKKDGSVLWKSESDEAGYSSAVLQRVGEVPQAIFFTGRRALGVDTRDGRLLWDYARVSNGTANIATPIVSGNKVFLSSDYGTGAALLEMSPSGKGIAAKEVYFTREMRNHHSSSILVGDHLYGFNSSILTSMHFADGRVAWRNRSVGKGSLAYADERLYLYSEDGVVGLAEASPTAYVEHGRFRLRTGSLPTWSHPVVANGTLYLRDQDQIYAYDVRAK